jgi:hypothetical protein
LQGSRRAAATAVCIALFHFVTCSPTVWYMG